MVSLPHNLKEVAPRVFCGFAHLVTQKASSAEQQQACYFLKVNEQHSIALKHNNGFNRGLECTKDLQAESVDILKRGCNRLFQVTVVLLESML